MATTTDLWVTLPVCRSTLALSNIARCTLGPRAFPDALATFPMDNQYKAVHANEHTIEENLEGNPQRRTVQQAEARLTVLSAGTVTGTMNFTLVTVTFSSRGLVARSFVVTNLTTGNCQHWDHKEMIYYTL